VKPVKELYLVPKLLMELKNSPNFIQAYKMKEHRSMGGLDGPCVFSTKPTHPPRSSNTQGPSRAHLNFLSILGLVWKRHNFRNKGTLKGALLPAPIGRVMVVAALFKAFYHIIGGASRDQS
jgi:hypothetical protein